MHTPVWTVTLFQVLNQKADQQASVGLFHKGGRKVNSPLPHVLCSYMHGLYGANDPSILPFSPHEESVAFVEVFYLDAQQDFPVGGRGLFESGLFLPAV